jgi:hypothetical protein
MASSGGSAFTAPELFGSIIGTPSGPVREGMFHSALSSSSPFSYSVSIAHSFSEEMQERSGDKIVLGNEFETMCR